MKSSTLLYGTEGRIGQNNNQNYHLTVYKFIVGKFILAFVGFPIFPKTFINELRIN